MIFEIFKLFSNLPYVAWFVKLTLFVFKFSLGLIRYCMWNKTGNMLQVSNSLRDHTFSKKHIIKLFIWIAIEKNVDTSAKEEEL